MQTTMLYEKITPVEPLPSAVEDRELVVEDPDHEAVLSWHETIERTNAATELILHS